MLDSNIKEGDKICYNDDWVNDEIVFVIKKEEYMEIIKGYWKEFLNLTILYEDKLKYEILQVTDENKHKITLLRGKNE